MVWTIPIIFVLQTLHTFKVVHAVTIFTKCTLLTNYSIDLICVMVLRLCQSLLKRREGLDALQLAYLHNGYRKSEL